MALTAAGVATAALTVTGASTASTWDLVPALFLIGMGAGMSLGQLFSFILAGVSLEEVGSASGVPRGRAGSSPPPSGVAVLGTIFFSAFSSHLPTDALEVTAWACLVPLVACFLLIFRLPMQPLPEEAMA